MHIYINMQTHTYTHVCVHVHIHIYTCAQAYTHMHSYTYMPNTYVCTSDASIIKNVFIGSILEISAIGSGTVEEMYCNIA